MLNRTKRAQFFRALWNIGPPSRKFRKTAADKTIEELVAAGLESVQPPPAEAFNRAILEVTIMLQEYWPVYVQHPELFKESLEKLDHQLRLYLT